MLLRRLTERHRLLRAFLFVLTVLFLTALPTRAQSSMFADPKARQQGDLLTIVLAERTAAHRESDWENKSNAAVSAATDVSSGDDLSGRFALDAALNKQAKSKNLSRQSDLLSGTVTARVTEVDPAGNLVIQGERKLNVNGESHLLRISGVVRPFDVRHDNSVLSFQIADADIEYRRAGLGRKYIKPGFMARTGLVALVGAAIYFLVQN